MGRIDYFDGNLTVPTASLPALAAALIADSRDTDDNPVIAMLESARYGTLTADPIDTIGKALHAEDWETNHSDDGTTTMVFHGSESDVDLPLNVIARYGTARVEIEDSDGTKWLEGCSGGTVFEADAQIVYPGEPATLTPPAAQPPIEPWMSTSGGELSDAVLDTLLRATTTVTDGYTLDSGADDPTLDQRLPAHPGQAADAVAERLQGRLEALAPLLDIVVTYDRRRGVLTPLMLPSGAPAADVNITFDSGATLGQACRPALRAVLTNAWTIKAPEPEPQPQAAAHG